MFDANNDLLTGVTAFGKADRVVEIGFVDYGVVIHVDAVARYARFDSQNLLRRLVDRHGPCLLKLFPPRVPLCLGHDDVETFLGSMGGWKNVEFLFRSTYVAPFEIVRSFAAELTAHYVYGVSTL